MRCVARKGRSSVLAVGALGIVANFIRRSTGNHTKDGVKAINGPQKSKASSYLREGFCPGTLGIETGLGIDTNT